MTTPNDNHPTCRLCGKPAFQINGYLHRVNEKGVSGIWECRPSCDAKLTQDEALLAALKAPPAPVATEKTAEELRADFDALMIQAKQDVADLKSGYTGKGGVRYAPVATERPTPETDALIEDDGLIVLTMTSKRLRDKARSLERQRDELAERLAEPEKKRAAESLQYSKNLALIAMRENDAQNALRADLAESEAGRVQAEKERESARQRRDITEADFRQCKKMLAGVSRENSEVMERLGVRDIAAKAARALPPDVLTSPMPLPDRWDYAEAVISRAIIEAINTIKA